MSNIVVALATAFMIASVAFAMSKVELVLVTLGITFCYLLRKEL